MSDFLSERVNEQKSTNVRECRFEEHSCEELQRKCRKAKFSSPKPPRASGKTSGFMQFQRALVREGAAAWPGLRLPSESGFLQGSQGLTCFSWLLLLLFLLHTNLVKTILQSNSVS